MKKGPFRQAQETMSNSLVKSNAAINPLDPKIYS